MCGIAGYLTIQPHRQPDTVLDRMTGRIHHRGPDAGGEFRHPHVQLGHRRLSIVDLASGGQPMFNEDGRIVVVYNGEIFNHASLRPELERAGHTYRNHSDTEAILHAWEQWGPRSLDRYRGMFAFALWDENRRTLFCARDRLGIKPFYYWWDGATFVFASEIKAILAHPRVTTRCNESLFSEQIAFGFQSGEETLFQGIRKLMPGHHLMINLNAPSPQPEIVRYWDVPKPAVEERSEESWIAECRQRLEQTVSMRLMADVPLGMFLSGGVDSSAIAAIMKRITTGAVKSYSVGYAETEYSELGYARHVAERIGTDHHEVSVSMNQFFNALPKLIWHEDEPIAWPSSVSLYFVSQLAARDVKVVLTGEGSDELFAGYSRYRFYKWNCRAMDAYRVVPGPARRALASWIDSTSLLPAGPRRKLGHTFLARGGEVESLYLDNFYCAFPAAEQKRLFRLPDRSPYTGFLESWNAAAGRPWLARMLYADLKTYLVELLMKQDQMSMATSIESRVPFLDHTFVEFSTRVPDSLKIRGKEGKYILKRAVEDLLPREIIYRKKMGFPTPLQDWLRSPRAEALFAPLLHKDSFLAPYTEREPLAEMLGRHRSGQIDATDRIWRLLNLQVWGDLHFTGRRDEVWDGLLAPGGA
jgi:asparagine synthase (glutamine-hydrolysing)